MKPILLIALFLLTTALVDNASAACGPPKCPQPAPRPTDPLKPTPNPIPDSIVTVIGYFEVASPECTVEDYQQSVAGAQRAALRDARQRLNTEDVQQVTPFRYSYSCEQSIYAGSFKGNSWIVQAFAKYERQKP